MSSLIKLFYEQLGSITPYRYTSNAQWYRLFTRPAVRTGLLWKIPPDGALRLSTPHFAYGIKTLTQRKTGIFYWNPSYPSSSNAGNFPKKIPNFSFLIVLKQNSGQVQLHIFSQWRSLWWPLRPQVRVNQWFETATTTPMYRSGIWKLYVRLK